MSITMRMINRKIVINGKSIRINDNSALEKEIEFLRQNQITGKTIEKNVQKSKTRVHNTYNVETSMRLKPLLIQTLESLKLNPVESAENIKFSYGGTEISAFVAEDSSYTFIFNGNESAKSVQDCMKMIIDCYGTYLQQAVYDQIVCRAESENLKLVEERIEKDKTVVLVYEM